ncbi:MAG: hypothetical protein ABSB40_11985 [Nitrososphaeria archaeon]|jgi:hypothetical protein
MPFGYNQIFTDIPESWITAGVVSIGTTGAPTFTTKKPSGLISSITRTGIGAYTLALSQGFPEYEFFKAEVIGADGYTIRTETITIGTTPTATSATLPVITIQAVSGSSAAELPSSSKFCFLLIVKKMSL